MATNRQVGPLWCSDVIALLGDYLDGDLTPTQLGDVEQHLAGCPECTRFGGEFGAVVEALAARQRPEVSAELAQRLEAVLARQR
jgi:anti-sigma factor RsiW